MRHTRALTIVALAVSTVVLLAAPASAHVSIPGTAPKGGYSIVTFSVPNESDAATTTKFEVKIPEDAQLRSVRAQPKPGWTVTTTTRTLTTPVTDDDGPVTEAVDTVTWEGGAIAAGQFETFSLSVGPLPTDEDEVAFPAIQTYSDGTETAWIEATPASGEEPEHPQPVLHLVEATDADHAHADTTDDGNEDSDGTGLAAAALVVAVLALGVGGAGLLAARRR